MRVMTVLVQVFRVEDPRLLAAAVLHDTIEDTTVDFDDLLEEFGAEVARAVALLSKDTRLPEEARERAYVAALAGAPVGVQLCKLADVYDNLIDSRSAPAQRRAQTVGKASAWLQTFRGALERAWPHVLEAVRQQLERTQEFL
jgi:guanosine-3',5'-bis(diphosphate) 3'-pyrophosphohydrolase